MTDDREPFKPSAFRRAAVVKLRRCIAQHPPTLDAPADGWQRALEMLVFRVRCPWCGHPARGLHVGPEGLTWDCPEGCNP